MSAPATTAAPAGEAPAAPPNYLRWGIGIVVVIFIIYVVTSVKAFSDSPVGQAISAALGAAGAILTALAGLPAWVLVGLGFAYLLGPAIVKMAGPRVRDLAAAAQKGNAEAAAAKAAGRSQDEIDAYARGVATEAVKLIRDADAAAAGAPQDAQERAAQAEQAAASAQAEAAGKGPEVAAADESGREVARETIEPVK